MKFFSFVMFFLCICLLTLGLATPLSVVYWRLIKYLRLEYDKVGIHMNFKIFLLLFVLLMYILGHIGVVLVNHFLGSFLSLLVFLIPSVIFRFVQRIRLSKFELQLPDALFLCSNSLKAGFSLLQAFEMVVREMNSPLHDEFERIVKDIRLGLCMEEALQNLRMRIKSDDVELFVTAVIIQLQMGGNLAELFQTIAGVIKERRRIQDQVKTMTSQGRLTGIVILVLPIALWFIVNTLDPNFFEPLNNNPIGVMIIVGAIVMEVLGVIMIRKICSIDF